MLLVCGCGRGESIASLDDIGEDSATVISKVWCGNRQLFF